MDPSTTNEKVDGWHAYLLNVDIVGFSAVPQEWLQKAMVRFVVSALLDHPLMQGRTRDEAYHLNSTGDGFILAIPSSGPEALPLELCDLSLDLVKACETFPHRQVQTLEVRAGVHVGTLSLDFTLHDGMSFGIGTGLNWCTRVASIANAGMVVASEEFVAAVADRFPPDWLVGRFHPALEKAPLAYEVKHGKLARVRVLARPTNGRARGPSLERPSPLLEVYQRIQRIDGHLRVALGLVAQATVAAVQAVDEGATETDISPRLTLWRRTGDELRAVRTRVSLPEPPQGAPLEPSSTRYRLHRGSRDLPEGPVAEAWVTQEPTCLLALPEPGTEAYDAALHRAGIPLSTVDGFTRHARTWLCVPLLLLDEPTGVLCIDLALPLANRVVADRLLDEILVNNAYYLAALLHIGASLEAAR